MSVCSVNQVVDLFLQVANLQFQIMNLLFQFENLRKRNRNQISLALVLFRRLPWFDFYRDRFWTLASLLI